MIEKNEVLTQLEQAWGKPSYKSGLDLFATSHASVADGVKVDSSDLVITDLDEILQTTNK